MKKIYTISVVLLVWVGGLSAQSNAGSIRTGDIRMIRTGDDVTVSFLLEAGRRSTARASHDLVIEPVLKNGVSQRPLPSVVVRGRRSRVIAARHELGGGKRTREQSPMYMQAGESFEYTATLPYEEWMRGGELVFEGVSVGCCSSSEVDLGLVAGNVLYGEPRIEERVVEIPEVVAPPAVTTGEKLAARYPFVAPVEEYERLRAAFDGGPDMVQGAIGEIRGGSISIYFDQSVRVVDRNFGDNNRRLVELISAVRALASAPDSKIAMIVIAGFASPEGSPELNDRLAWDRAVAVKEFLTENSPVDGRAIRIFNGGADWAGLKKLVEESSIYRKQRIVDIIENTPVWDSRRGVGRRGELMRLDGGDPYRYMLTNFFPKLRQAAYIRVYYEPK
jgi:outer membrane protein OmpA-like peptidoglycan-associated protein